MGGFRRPWGPSQTLPLRTTYSHVRASSKETALWTGEAVNVDPEFEDEKKPVQMIYIPRFSKKSMSCEKPACDLGYTRCSLPTESAFTSVSTHRNSLWPHHRCLWGFHIPSKHRQSSKCQVTNTRVPGSGVKGTLGSLNPAQTHELASLWGWLGAVDFAVFAFLGAFAVSNAPKSNAECCLVS